MSFQSNASVAQSNKSQPYIDLGKVPLPSKLRIGDQELEVSQLSDQQKAILIDLSRIDKEISDTEFSLRVLKAAKMELSRLLAIPSISK